MTIRYSDTFLGIVHRLNNNVHQQLTNHESAITYIKNLHIHPEGALRREERYSTIADKDHSLAQLMLPECNHVCISICYISPLTEATSALLWTARLILTKTAWVPTPPVSFSVCRSHSLSSLSPSLTFELLFILYLLSSKTGNHVDVHVCVLIVAGCLWRERKRKVRMGVAER